MAAVSEVITLGIGTPSGIAYWLLFGLAPEGVVPAPSTETEDILVDGIDEGATAVDACGGAKAMQTALEYWLGTDKSYVVTVYRSSAKSAIRDIAGYTLNFMIKRAKSDADGSALFSGTATVSGTYSSDPAANTQVATAQIADTDLPATTTTAGQVQWELKRTDAGAEAILAYGRMLLRRPVHDA